MGINNGPYASRCRSHPTGKIRLKEYRLTNNVHMPIFSCATCGHRFTSDVGIRLLNHSIGISTTIEEHAISSLRENK
jgi:hypothetical protein